VKDALDLIECEVIPGLRNRNTINASRKVFPKKQVFLVISISIDIVRSIISHMLEVAGGSGYPKGKHDICA
jgi:hypothetical protein